MAKDELAELLDGPLGDDWLSTVDLEYPFADTSGEVAGRHSGVGGQELLLTYLLNGEHCRDTCEAVSSVRATTLEDVVDDKQVVLAAAAAAGLTRSGLKHAFSSGDLRLGYTQASPKLQHTRSNVSSLISVPEAGSTREFESVAIPDSFTSSSQPEGGGAEVSEMDERSSGDVLGILSTEELEQELCRRKAKIGSQGQNTTNLFGAESIGIGRIGQRRSLHQVPSQGVFQPFQNTVTTCGLSVAGPRVNYQSTNPAISTISGMGGNSNHSGHSGLPPPASGLSQGLLPQLVGSLSSSLIQSHQSTLSQGMTTQPSYNQPIQFGVSGRDNFRYTLPASHSGSSVPAVYQPAAMTYSGVPRSISSGSYTVQPTAPYTQPPPSNGMTIKTTVPQANSDSSNSLRKCHSTPILPSLISPAPPGMQIPVIRGDPTVGEERRIGTLTLEERRQRILRYKQKARRFDRRVTYQCRKTLADTRPRVRGRFARNDDKDAVMPPELKPPVEKRRKTNKKDSSVEVVYLLDDVLNGVDRCGTGV